MAEDDRFSMTKTFFMKISAIQPSQLYISSEKLSSVTRALKQTNPVSVEPIPVKKLDDQIIFVDGHTRAFAAFLLGLSEVPVYWEDEELDWDEYRICVRWCKDEGIHTISDLKKRVISHRDYRILWLDRCGKMQADLEAKKKAKADHTRKSGEMRLKLPEIKSRLQHARVEWAVFARAAASCYGSRRRITDVDILVKCEDLEKARASLEDIDVAGFDIGCGATIETPNGECPFFLDDEMIKRISWKEFFGVTVPVISVEDNIVFKAILQRGEDKGKHDVEDIRCMAANEKVDIKYLRKRILKSRADERVMPLLRQLIPGLLQGSKTHKAIANQENHEKRR